MTPFVFDHAELQRLAEDRRASFAAAEPFPHVVIDDFLPEQVADDLLQRFPPPDAPNWFDWRERDVEHQPRKLGIGNASRLEGVDPSIHHVLWAFNSFAFIDFLNTLSGIEGLLADPYLHGGGLHQVLPGGHLAIHSDFNFQGRLKLYRRINALLYLNKDWKSEWGGQLELWTRERTHCVQSIEPAFNRLVLFNTASAPHGHPAPLACPESVTRKSLALYYYTRDPEPGDEEQRPTLWND